MAFCFFDRSGSFRDFTAVPNSYWDLPSSFTSVPTARWHKCDTLSRHWNEVQAGSLAILFHGYWRP